MTIWTVYDASKEDPQIARTLSDFALRYARLRGHSIHDAVAVRERALTDLEDYRAGEAHFLDKAISINVFEPHEFKPDRANDEAIRLLCQWLLDTPIEWRKRSDRFKALINGRFSSAGSTRINLQGDTLILDALVSVASRRVAVEFEVSKNLDNGITSLRMAVRDKSHADFGVIIVPLCPRGAGMANGRTALNRIDADFDKTNQIGNGAVYRIAVIRWLDVCQRLAYGGYPPHRSDQNKDT